MEKADILAEIPEGIRAQFEKMMDQQIQQRVDKEVKDQLSKLEQDLNNVKEQLKKTNEELKVAQTPQPNKTFGMSRPSTAASSTTATPRKSAATSRIQTGLKAKPSGGLADGAESQSQKDMLKTPGRSNASNTTTPQRATGSTLGLKRPSTAIASKAAGSGLKAPSSMMSNVASKLGFKLKTDMAKPVPRKSNPQPVGPVSAAKDEVDEIYKAEDPIETSIAIRQKGGALQTVVADKNAKVGKFFFTLKTKGAEVKISKEAIKASQIMAGAKVDASGNIIEEEKPKPDPIDKSLALRIKEGALTNIVADKTKKKDTEITFKLKLKGTQPKISAVREDPSQAKENAAAKAIAEQQKLAATPCDIDASLQTRINLGSVTNTVPSKTKSTETAFKLRTKGTMPKIKEVYNPFDKTQDADQEEFSYPDSSPSPKRNSLRGSVKLGPDEIDTSLQARLKEGSLTSTIPNKDKKTDEVVFKLKIKGQLPKLKEAAVDPSQAQEVAAAKVEAEQKKISATACEIDLSIAQRTKAGSLTSTVPVDKSKPQEVAFKLKLKGEIKIANEVKEDPKDAGAIAAKKAEAEQKKISATACEIDLSIAQRTKAGSLTSTVPVDKSKPQEILFKLKLKGEIQIANEVKEDPNDAGAIAAKKAEAEQKKITATPCDIDISMAQRLKAGSVTSTVPADKSKTEVVFSIKVKSEYKLAEARTDPSQVKEIAVAKAEAEQKKIETNACEIDASLQERIVLGSVTSQTNSPQKSDAKSFVLKQKGEMVDVEKVAKEKAAQAQKIADEKAAEAQRVAQGKAKTELKAQEEKLIKEKAEADKIAQEKAKTEQKAQEEKLIKEKAAEAAQKAQEDKLIKEKAEAEQKVQEEKLIREKAAEAERIAQEKAHAEQKAQEEKLIKEKAEAQRLANEKAEAERIAQEKAHAQQKTQEEEKLIKEKAEAERVAQEKAHAQQKAQEEEKLIKEKAEAEVTNEDVDRVVDDFFNDKKLQPTSLISMQKKQELELKKIEAERIEKEKAAKEQAEKLAKENAEKAQPPFNPLQN